MKNKLMIVVVCILLVGIVFLSIFMTNKDNIEDIAKVNYEKDEYTNEYIIRDENGNERGRVSNIADIKMYEDNPDFSSQSIGTYNEIN